MHVKIIDTMTKYFKKGQLFEVLMLFERNDGRRYYLVGFPLGARVFQPHEGTILFTSPNYDKKTHFKSGYMWLRHDHVQLIDVTTNADASSLLSKDRF